MRLFVAVYPPREQAADLSSLVETLALGRRAAEGAHVKLSPIEHWHVTVAFLGEVDDDRLPDVAEALAEALASWRVERAALPTLRLSGGGRFGQGSSTILWAGLHGDVASLTSLASAVSTQLKRAGLPTDPKPFRPHLTLGRPGDQLTPAELESDLAKLDGHYGPLWTVNELVLVRSYLDPQPHYEKITVLPLVG
jgi:2'-5' RNA ligase